ncbi:hypothetical protein IWX49DRAFT_638608 [Phyllosticta citricarpa]
MPSYYPSISDDFKKWLLSQPLFFVATAPLTGTHINVSPKGLPSQSLAVLGPNQVAYLDATGSGCETISHIYENGRVTLMTCSFGKVPRIMRLYCTGRVIERGPSADNFEAWLKRTGIKHGVEACRAVIVLDVFKVSDYTCVVVRPPHHCNTADPEAQSQRPPQQQAFTDRQTLGSYARKLAARSPNALLDYHMQNNVRSLDGCPGLRTARAAKGEWVALADFKAKARRAVYAQWEGVLMGLIVAIAVAAMLIWLGRLRVQVVV